MSAIKYSVAFEEWWKSIDLKTVDAWHKQIAHAAWCAGAYEQLAKRGAA